MCPARKIEASCHIAVRRSIRYGRGDNIFSRYFEHFYFTGPKLFSIVFSYKILLLLELFAAKISRPLVVRIRITSTMTFGFTTIGAFASLLVLLSLTSSTLQNMTHGPPEVINTEPLYVLKCCEMDENYNETNRCVKKHDGVDGRFPVRIEFKINSDNTNRSMIDV